jgi:hypothetical protein
MLKGPLALWPFGPLAFLLPLFRFLVDVPGLLRWAGRCLPGLLLYMFSEVLLVIVGGFVVAGWTGG